MTDRQAHPKGTRWSSHDAAHLNSTVGRVRGRSGGRRAGAPFTTSPSASAACHRSVHTARRVHTPLIALCGGSRVSPAVPGDSVEAGPRRQFPRLVPEYRRLSMRASQGIASTSTFCRAGKKMPAGRQTRSEHTPRTRQTRRTRCRQVHGSRLHYKILSGKSFRGVKREKMLYAAGCLASPPGSRPIGIQTSTCRTPTPCFGERVTPRASRPAPPATQPTTLSSLTQ